MATRVLLPAFLLCASRVALATHITSARFLSPSARFGQNTLRGAFLGGMVIAHNDPGSHSLPSDLFDALEKPGPSRQVLADGAVLLRGFVQDLQGKLLAEVERIAASAPFRHMVTRSGHTMSVAMTSCGPLGWVSDRRGYRYVPDDPDTGQPWPAMPDSFRQIAATAAAQAGFDGFERDACLINRYEPGTRLSLHQDRDERHLDAPIVSVSLGLPATFLFGGLRRADPAQRVRLVSGDVVAWGGPARLAFHGVLPLPEGEHPLTGRCRINLTFRQAG